MGQGFTCQRGGRRIAPLYEVSSPNCYRRIPGFHDYSAGDDGCIYRVQRRGGGGFTPRWTRPLDEPRKLKPDIRPIDGRKRYTLRRDDGKYIRKYGSYFVLLAFVGPRPDGMEACHDNGDCTDDTRRNLRWDTPVNNKADMVRHGTQRRGEKHHKAKVTDAQAISIILRRNAGEKLRVLAKEFGVTESAICYIAKGKRHQCL